MALALDFKTKRYGPTRRVRDQFCVLTDRLPSRLAVNQTGRGTRRTFANLVAEILTLEDDRVVLLPGDTDALATGTGTGGSAALTTTGAALSSAANLFRKKIIEVAAEQLEVAPGDILFSNGRYEVVGTDLSIDLFELANDPHVRARVVAQGVQEITFTTTAGCHAAWVTVDIQTAQVCVQGYTSYDDIGKALDPALLDARIHGGVAQGIGQALGEQMRYDTQTGQLLTASLMDYWIARADDLPFFTLTQGHTLAANPLGTRGAGEAGAIPASAVVANAVADALGPLTTTLDLPLTPDNVWMALIKSV